eukprot:CAMPEP_0172718228 /NCGR_PEP_ID=MMETSP1074-20121228/73755_1 /TAXON_ID=2916 /ORGANISM="Ceratium fusus, Strain PA161109" /LENGTH=61 /DNA_ID=CAMNT_0013543351 /DNA_START=28 /DNA_END=210 /DNA_ORIENTATION=+
MKKTHITQKMKMCTDSNTSNSSWATCEEKKTLRAPDRTTTKVERPMKPNTLSSFCIPPTSS